MIKQQNLFDKVIIYFTTTAIENPNIHYKDEVDLTLETDLKFEINVLLHLIY